MQAINHGNPDRHIPIINFHGWEIADLRTLNRESVKSTNVIFIYFKLYIRVSISMVSFRWTVRDSTMHTYVSNLPQTPFHPGYTLAVSRVPWAIQQFSLVICVSLLSVHVRLRDAPIWTDKRLPQQECWSCSICDSPFHFSSNHSISRVHDII